MRIFVAGATGATGSVFVPEATRAGLELVLHVRPKTAVSSPLAGDPRARVFELDDLPALADALSGSEAIVSFVGTMRDRFKAGDTYASSDVGSTRALADGARRAGVPRFLLLSSVGAGGAGAYLKMKAECEAIVRDSRLRWTVFHPSVLVTPEGATAGSHGARRAPPMFGGLLGALGALPGLAGFADDYKPIPLDVLVWAFLQVLEWPKDGAVLTGRELWALGARRRAEDQSR